MIGSIILLIILIFLNAVFASAEIAVISMNESKLKKLTEEKKQKSHKTYPAHRTAGPIPGHYPGSNYPGRFPEQCFCCRLFCRAFG